MSKSTFEGRTYTDGTLFGAFIQITMQNNQTLAWDSDLIFKTEKEASNSLQDLIRVLIDKYEAKGARVESYTVEEIKNDHH